MGSRFPGFYRLSPEARRERVALARDLPARYVETYSPEGGLPLDAASLMIENVIGVMSLPVGIGLNLLVNDRDYLVPMVVEEPSVVAAVSGTAKLARATGGIRAETETSLMIGQIQVLDCPDWERAARRLKEAEKELIAAGNLLLPRLARRGGGVRAIRVRDLVYEENGTRVPMLVVHVVVDTLDAMGANLVNTLVERLSPDVRRITGGTIGLRILSNLADQRLVRARMRLPASSLAGKGFSGEAVIDGVLSADRFAVADPYRAATHNKGIMNGIDAVALATGNDWRAIEAGAHAYAARTGRYQPLSRWRKDSDGTLVGTLEMPMQVGIVGAAIQVHPTIRANLHILGVQTASELAQVMAAVGLAQNLAALRALVTVGIQRGHMSMQARTIAAAAGVPPEWIPEVIDRMVAAGSIHRDGAREACETLLAEMSESSAAGELLSTGRASGKVILLGEHAVVHGYPAIASSLERYVEVACRRRPGPAWVEAPALLTAGRIFDESEAPLKVALRRVFELLSAPREGISLTVTGNLPPGKGVGSSAALAVAGLRALARAINRDLEEAELLAFAQRVEQVFHGLPSGIDHTVAAKGGILRFRRAAPSEVTPLKCPRAFPIVLLDSGEVGPTSLQVGKVLSLLEQDPHRVDAIFSRIETLVQKAIEAIEAGDGYALGQAMNHNHELLRELELSTFRLDQLVDLARQAGAAGAKLTGAGGGGMVLAICPEGPERVLEAARERGVIALASQMPARDET